MLHTIVINSKNRLSGGTTSDYQITLQDPLNPDEVDYYKLRMLSWVPDSGLTMGPALSPSTVAVKMSFHQPFSYATSKRGPNDTVGFISVNGNIEAVALNPGFETIIKKPNFSTLRIWHQNASDGSAFTVDEHFIVLTLEPVKKV